ncbi:MAG: PKD domain-containing protein [Solirubrobacteraceae bacterium]
MPRLLPAALAVALCAAAPAAAATRCVAPESGCPGGLTYPTFQAAIGAATGAAGADTIQLGVATYTAPSASGYVVNDAAGQIEIAGRGDGTILTAPAGATSVLNIAAAAAGSSVHDLRVHLPASVPSGARGLAVEDTAVSRIAIDADPAQSGPHHGIALAAGSTLDDTTIVLSRQLNTYGVFAIAAGVVVTDTTVDGRNGFDASSSATFDRDTAIVTGAGYDLENDPSVVRNCLVRLGASGATGVYVGNGSGSTVTGCTFVDEGASSTVGVFASGTSGDAVVTVAGSLLVVDAAAERAGENGHAATITLHHSDFNSATFHSYGGAGAFVQGAGNAYHAASGFADAAAHDYRLRHDSPLVDAGDPAVADGADIGGGARKVDGNGNGSAIADVGAYEYQRLAPQGAVAGPVTAKAGEALTFSATATDPDPGDAAEATFAWSVDGAAPVAGATLPHTFVSQGLHTIVLTVTDPAGRTATAEHTVEVAGTVEVPAAVPPQATPPAVVPPAAPCVDQARTTLRLDRRLVRAKVRLLGRSLRVRRVKGRLTVRVDLREKKAGVYRVKVDGRTAKGRRLRSTRRLRVCA